MSVAIVGAGFSGLMFAIALARAGANVDVYEEHARVGFPEHCTGLVSAYTAEMIGRPAEVSKLGVIESFVVSGPSLSARVRASRPVVKLDRVKLEEVMAEEAESEGVRINYGLRAKVSPEGVVTPVGKRYDAVILAEGYLGRQRTNLGIGFSGVPIYGVNAEYEGGGPEDFEARFDGVTSDGFFSWRVTLKSFSIIGTAARHPTELARRLAAAQKVFGVEGRPLTYYGGPILTGPYPKRVRAGRVVVVGDAASMNKPLTGGGLYPSALAATRAANLYTRGVPILYAVERAVRDTLSEMRKFYHVARLLHERPNEVDLIIRALSSSGLLDSLSGKIDYDRHHEVIRASLTTRRLLSAAIRAFIEDPMGALRILVSGLEDLV